MCLFTQDTSHVAGKLLTVEVGAIGDALHPHCAGQQVRAWEADLHRSIGEAPDEPRFVHGERPMPPQRAEHGGMPHLTRGHIERPELALELLWIADIWQEIRDRDQLAVLQQAADEAGIVIAPLLVVGDHVHVSTHLGCDS